MIDFDWCINHQACYDRELLRVLFKKPLSLRDVLSKKTQFWDGVPFTDRLWVATRYLSDEQLRQVVFNYIKTVLPNWKSLGTLENWLLAGGELTQEYINGVHNDWTNRVDGRYLLVIDVIRGVKGGWLSRLYRHQFDDTLIRRLIGEVL